LIKIGVGGFEYTQYWSSLEKDNGYVWTQYFYRNSQSNSFWEQKNFKFNVRAVRAFNSNISINNSKQPNFKLLNSIESKTDSFTNPNKNSEKISKLLILKNLGIITQEEFENKKNNIKFKSEYNN
jgi:hypothetical protein